MARTKSITGFGLGVTFGRVENLELQKCFPKTWIRAKSSTSNTRISRKKCHARTTMAYSWHRPGAASLRDLRGPRFCRTGMNGLRDTCVSPGTCRDSGVGRLTSQRRGTGVACKFKSCFPQDLPVTWIFVSVTPVRCPACKKCKPQLSRYRFDAYQKGPTPF